jgi:hypothetical protein
MPSAGLGTLIQFLEGVSRPARDLMSKTLLVLTPRSVLSDV